MRLTVNYEKPNPYLYLFNGSIEVENNKNISIDNNNFILRGCSLKNTEYIYGLTLYSGHDTKIMKNSIKPLRKAFTNVEKIMNKQILIIILMQIILCFFCAIYSTL